MFPTKGHIEIFDEMFPQTAGLNDQLDWDWVALLVTYDPLENHKNNVMNYFAFLLKGNEIQWNGNRIDQNWLHTEGTWHRCVGGGRWHTFLIVCSGVKCLLKGNRDKKNKLTSGYSKTQHQFKWEDGNRYVWKMPSRANFLHLTNH